MAQIVLALQAVTPDTPSAGKMAFYAKDGGMFVLDELGVETPMAGSSVWGSITGTIANQVDLTPAAIGAATVTHDHASTYQPLDPELTQIANLSDPNADRILFWDDSANSYAYLQASTGLTISGTTMTVRSASSTATGIAELATEAETQTGTDATRVVTPLGFKTAGNLLWSSISHDHAGIYDPAGTVSTHESTYAHADIATALQPTQTEHNLGSLGSTEELSIANGTKQRGVLDQSCTMTLATPSGACTIRLRLVNSGAGNVLTVSGVRWVTGTAPDLTTADGGENIIIFDYGSTGWVADGGPL